MTARTPARRLESGRPVPDLVGADVRGGHRRRRRRPPVRRGRPVRTGRPCPGRRRRPRSRPPGGPTDASAEGPRPSPSCPRAAVGHPGVHLSNLRADRSGACSRAVAGAAVPTNRALGANLRVGREGVKPPHAGWVPGPGCDRPPVECHPPWPGRGRRLAVGCRTVAARAGPPRSGPPPQQVSHPPPRGTGGGRRRVGQLEAARGTPARRSPTAPSGTARRPTGSSSPWPRRPGSRTRWPRGSGGSSTTPVDGPWPPGAGQVPDDPGRVGHLRSRPG